MYKFLINFIIVSYLLMGTSNSESIKEIIIDGNKRISKETILVLGDIDINRDFTSNDLNNTLKKLYNTNFFRDIKISLSDGILNLSLQENPIIEEIEITGIKKKSLVENLYEKMKLKNRMSFTEISLKKDINLINNLLKINGYYFSKIETSLIENDDLNSIKINLNIDLGEKAKIKEIIFIGDKRIKDKKLLELIASEEHKFWKFISNKVYLNKSLIDLDKRLLENYYKTIFDWLEKCEKEFGFDHQSYGKIRIYGFLAERFMPYWFRKNSNFLEWPIVYYDIGKLNEKIEF